jgi:hypothetical protein
MDAKLEAGKAATSGTLGSIARRTPHGRPGRRPAKNPDGAFGAEALLKTVKKRFSFINESFNKLPDPRDASRILYSASSLLWTLTLGFLNRCGSRNAMDADRNDPAYAHTVMSMSGQDWWPEGEPLTTPCTGTACAFLEHVEPLALEAILLQTGRKLIRSKALDWARLNGYFVIALDGTKQENCRAGKLVDGKSRRMVLEAKLIGPDGLAIGMLCEPMDQYDDERSKHDCEIRACKRLLPRLKAAFPKLPICIVGDALYACEWLFNLCEEFGWKHILTFKEGSFPAVAEEAQAQLALQKDNQATLMQQNDSIRLQWLQNVWFTKRGLQIVYCTQKGESPYDGAFVTNFEVAQAQTAEAVAVWGRHRWSIESAFHVQKHGGFGLEHTFCTSDRQAANMHLLMLLAHLLWQVVYLGLLRRIYCGCRKLTQKKLAKLIQRAMHVLGAPPGGPSGEREFQLRFSSA